MAINLNNCMPTRCVKFGYILHIYFFCPKCIQQQISVRSQCPGKIHFISGSCKCYCLIEAFATAKFFHLYSANGLSGINKMFHHVCAVNI